MDWDKVKKQRSAEAKVKMPDTSNSNPKITDDDVNGFLNSIDSATKDVEKYLTEPTYSTRDERSGYRSTIRNQRNKANEIALYVAQNRNKYSNSDEILNHLDNYIESLRGLAAGVSKYGDFYSSNFKSEDDYNNYLDSIKKQEELLNFDTAAANKELSGLEAARNNIEYDVAYDTARSSRFGVSARKNIGVDQTERENLDRRISELKQKITLASRAQNAEKLRSNALNDIEFKKYSDQGASIKNPSMRDAEGFMTVFGKPIGGEDIGNIVTYSRDNWKEIAMGGANGGTVQGNAIYKYMTGEEVDIYNYYLAKEGAEKASEYLDSITENLNMRQALGIYDELEDKTALQYVFGVSAGLDQFGSGVRNTVKAIKGDDSYTPASSTQIASGMIREGLADDGAKLPEWMGGGSVGQLGYDAITNTTNNLPSMLVGSIFGPGAGAITMGASVYGNAYSEMINLGYDKNQANSYAALTAASEAGLQYLLGGISSLGGKVSNNVLKRIISNVDNAFAKIAIQYGGEMMSEFTEEYLQDVLDPYFKNLATGENNEVTLLSPDAMYSGILGALNAGAGNVTFGAINNVANNSYLNNYYKETYGEGVDSLIQEGLATEKDSKSYSLAEKLKAKTESGEDISGAAIRKLVEANEKQFNNADTAKIESAAEQRLKSLGETGDSAKIAKALTKQVKGEVLSVSEQKALDNSKYGQRVANELSPENIRSGNYSSSWAENIGTDRINADLYNLARETAGAKETTATGKESLQVEQNAPKAKQESAGAKVQTSETNSLPKAKNAVQSEFEVSDNGKTISNITGSESDVAEIVKIKNGEMTLKLENGETVNAKNVSYGSQGEALIYETVAKLDNISAPAADVLVKAYNSSGNISADVYARGIEEAYRYGKYNIPVSEMIERGAFAAELTAEQRNKAYRLGQMFGGKSVAKAQAIRTQSTMGQVKKAVSESKKGRVHFDGNMESLNERQRTSVSALEKISEALGVDFYLFESKEINGKRQGANGWYDPKDGSIHIDIYAGQNGEGTMLFTAAHELTHFIKEWSPAKFKVLANFLMQEYGKKGVSVNELVIAQQEKARRNGREISYDVAYEEVIADSMETMLADGNVIEKLAQLKAKDKTLWEKIKSFIDELVNKIREVYAGLTPNSEEGQYVAEMVDAVEKLQELFTEGVIEAAENFQTAQETDTKSKAKFSQRKIEEESAEVARLTEQYMAKRKELFQNEEKKRELLKSEEYGKLMDDVVKSGASPESLEAMSTWEKREGLSELSETVKNLKKEVREFYSQVNKAAAEEQKRKEIAAIEASGLSEADYHRKQAVKEFGYTPYFVDAAYILPNGKMLNFSGEKGAHYGSRGQDHRAIGTIFAGNVNGSEAMVKFMQEGNIRIMPEGPSVDISSVEQPTKEQYAVIKKFVREYSKEENFSIDFTDAKGHTVGSYSYEGKVNADRVVNDIKYFFENGETRPDSGIGQFLYSMRDSDGNELSKQQQEYFKDSKVRDEEGNLLVVYHGTRKADFTKFSRNYNFFTDSKDMADSYSQNGELYTGYLDIKNPFTIDAKGEKWSKIPIDTVTKKFLDSYGSSTFKEKGQWRTTPADIAAAIQDGIDEGEFDYDGIIIKNVDDTGSYYKTSDSIIANDYIVFNSKQFKNADNKAPTADPDIRYSDRDSDYMTAVESGDMKTAQRLVDEAAKEAGYSIKAYHGSDRFGFTKFSPSKSDDRISLFFSDSSEVAKSYTKGNEIRMVGKPLKDTPEIIKQAESVIEDYNNGDFDIDGDIYKVGNKYVIEDFSENGDKYVCRTAAEFVQVVELLKKGKGVGATYSTYLKMVNPLKVDAKGSQWNNIDFVPQELQSLLNERKEREDSFYKKQAEIRSYAKENGITMSEAIDKVSGYWELVDKVAEIEEQIEKFREDNQLFKETTTRDISHYAKSHGYDGVQISNVKDIGSYGLRMRLEDTDDPMRFVMKTPSEMSTVYVAFNSEQVKSADPVTYDDNGNVIPLSERFKKENDDIRYSDRDSDGNELSKQQQEYFKDSKARDENGNLLVLYHGGYYDTVFTGRGEGFTYNRNAIYMSEREDIASAFSYGAGNTKGNVYKLYANIKNPFVIDAEGRSYVDIPIPDDAPESLKDKFWYDNTADLDNLPVWAEQEGYDGIIVYNVREGVGGGPATEVIAFRSNQVKFVDNKAPTADPDIRYQDRDSTSKPRSAQAQRDEGYMLNENKFYQFYSIHQLDIGGRWGSIDEQIKSIRQNGFQGGSGAINVLPVSALRMRTDSSGNPIFSDITQKQYAPKKGDAFLLVPKSGLTKDMAKVEQGFKPLDYEIVTADYDYQSPYEMYTKAYEMSTKGTDTDPDIRYQDRNGDVKLQDRIDIADRNRAVILQNKAERLEKELADLERAYKKAQDYARAEGILAGQIEQGAQMAKELRQKQESFNRKVEGYEKTISDKRNQIAEIRAKRDELLAKAKAEKTEAVAKARQKAVETQREIITRYQESRKKAVEGRHQTEMRHKIKGVVNELNQLLLHGTKDRHVMIGLQKAVAEALDAVNMDTIGADERVAKYDALIAKANDPDVIASLTATRDRIRRQGDNLSEKIAQLKAAYGDIKNSDDPLVANGYDEVIASKIDAVVSTVGNTPLRAMSTKQLEDVYDMYKMVLTRIRGANESFKSAKKEAISVLGNRVMMEVEHVGGKHPYRLKGSEKIEGFMWNNLKPVYAFEKIGSKTLTELYNNVRAGEDTFAKDVTEAREFFVKENRKYHYDKWNMDKTFSFKSKTGQSFKLTIPQIMSLYAYSKRNQADKHLELGGFVFDSNIEVTQKKKGIPVKYTVNTATAHNISKETLGDIIGKLTAEQKAFVDEMQDFLSTTMGEKGNEVSLAMYGVKLFKEKHYFPLKSAKQFMFEQNETAGEVKLKNSGFSKETVVNASNPIILSNFMDVWANHVNDMSMYHSFVLPLEDFNRVFNYKTPNSESLDTESVKQFIQNAYGKEANAYIKQLLTDLNGGAVSDPRETTAKRLISNFKKAAVFSSASVVIQQPSAIGRALAIIDPKYFVGGKIGARGHSALWAEVKKYAPVAIIKEMGYFDTNMGRSTVDFITAKEYKGFTDKAKGIIADSSYRDEILSKAPALADEITWCTIWNAVKRETKAKHKELTPGSEEFLKAAGARFTEVITKTQVYDSILSRSANMRSKSTFMSMWTSFMGEPTTSINMIEDAIRQGKRGNKKYAAKAIGAVFTSMVLNSLLVSLVYAARDDDEDETYLEKYLASLTSEVIEGINPLTYLPFFKDVWSSLQGFDIERADMSLITKLIESTQKAYKVYTEDTEGMTEDELLEHDKKVVEANWSIVDGISSLIGLPVKNLRRDINGAINLVRTVEKDLGGRKTTMGSLADKIEEAVRNSVPILGWGKGESRGDRLYDAIIAGDETYVNRIKDSIGDDQKYANMRFATLRDNDPRIKEAAQTAFGGDYAGAKKIAEAIIAEGNFSRNEVFGVISTELTKLKNAGKENSYKEKDKLLFGANDFFNAAKNNNVKDANAIRDELIAKKQDEGYLKWEAINSVESSFTSEVKKSYIDGDITAQKAKDILMKYGGKESVSEAETEIKKWNFELKQGYTWSARARGYRLGDISKQELISAVMDIEGDDEEGAELYIRFLDLAKNNEDIEITSYDASSYFKYAEPAGIEVATFLDYKDEASKCKGEKDEYGNTIRNTKKAQILLVIDALPITNEQKDALYFANGWAQSTLKDAPWH